MASTPFISVDQQLAQTRQEAEAFQLPQEADQIQVEMDKVLQELGGTDFIRQWAESNPGQFIALRAKLAMGRPTQAQATIIETALPPTPLDAPTDAD